MTLYQRTLHVRDSYDVRQFRVGSGVKGPSRSRRRWLSLTPWVLSTNLLNTAGTIGGRMIVEGLVTSLDRDGRLNVAPMGPIVSGNFEALVLRPFQPSTTFDNLNATRCGVFHVVDRVEVIGKRPQPPV